MPSRLAALGPTNCEPEIGAAGGTRAHLAPGATVRPPTWQEGQAGASCDWFDPRRSPTTEIVIWRSTVSPLTTLVS